MGAAKRCDGAVHTQHARALALSALFSWLMPSHSALYCSCSMSVRTYHRAQHTHLDQPVWTLCVLRSTPRFTAATHTRQQRCGRLQVWGDQLGESGCLQVWGHQLWHASPAGLPAAGSAGPDAVSHPLPVTACGRRRRCQVRT